jgi:hypothetical protein
MKLQINKEIRNLLRKNNVRAKNIVTIGEVEISDELYIEIFKAGYIDNIDMCYVEHVEKLNHLFKNNLVTFEQFLNQKSYTYYEGVLYEMGYHGNYDFYNMLISKFGIDGILSKIVTTFAESNIHLAAAMQDIVNYFSTICTRQEIKNFTAAVYEIALTYKKRPEFFAEIVDLL